MADGRDEVAARADEDSIEFFLAMFVDLHGKPCAKAVPRASLEPADERRRRVRWLRRR
jgi:glutamine synthetase